jgi:hypothetical protein
MTNNTNMRKILETIDKFSAKPAINENKTPSTKQLTSRVSRINESTSPQLIAKYTKDEDIYYLWRTGEYTYQLDTKDFKKIAKWTEKDLEDVKAEINSKGYNEDELSENADNKFVGTVYHLDEEDKSNGHMEDCDCDECVRRYGFNSEIKEDQTDNILEPLSKAIYILGNSNAYSKQAKDIFSLIHHMLRTRLMKNDMEGFTQAYNDLQGRYPDEFDEFIDTAFENAGLTHHATIEDFIALMSENNGISSSGDVSIEESIDDIKESLVAAFEDYVSNEKYDYQKLYPKKVTKPTTDKKKPKIEKAVDPKLIQDNLTESRSELLANSIIDHIMVDHPDLISYYGKKYVDAAIKRIADTYANASNQISKDINSLVDQVKHELQCNMKQIDETGALTTLTPSGERPWKPSFDVPKKKNPAIGSLAFEKLSKYEQDKLRKISDARAEKRYKIKEGAGASTEAVANAIAARLDSRHPEIFTRYGVEYVYTAIEEVASFHAGTEELGTSDISIMVREVIKELESKTDALDESIKEYTVYCSQCGGEFKNNVPTGFSHCRDHAGQQNLDGGVYKGDMDLDEMSINRTKKPSENRDLWDKINRKGVVPSIDRVRYTDLSHEGLEGPFRAKNGQVLYYDPKEGKYYDRDKDMYVDHGLDESTNKKPKSDIFNLPIAYTEDKVTGVKQTDTPFFVYQNRKVGLSGRSTKSLKEAKEFIQNQTTPTKHAAIQRPNKRFATRDIVDSREFIEYVTEFRRKLGNSVSNRYESTDVKKICSSIFARAELRESANLTTARKQFIDKFTSRDQFDQMNIAKGKMASVIETMVVGNYIELWGFVKPKKITQIEYKDNGEIEFIIFNNDTSTRYPRIDAASYQGESIDHSIFLKDQPSAEQTIVMLMLAIPHGFKPKYNITDYADPTDYSKDNSKKLIPSKINETKSLSKKVKIVSGQYSGQTGWIREIKHGAFKGAPKRYYVDLDNGDQANNLLGTALRLIKEPSNEPIVNEESIADELYRLKRQLNSAYDKAVRSKFENDVENEQVRILRRKIQELKGDIELRARDQMQEGARDIISQKLKQINDRKKPWPTRQHSSMQSALDKLGEKLADIKIDFNMDDKKPVEEDAPIDQQVAPLVTTGAPTQTTATKPTGTIPPGSPATTQTQQSNTSTQPPAAGSTTPNPATNASTTPTNAPAGTTQAPALTPGQSLVAGLQKVASTYTGADSSALKSGINTLANQVKLPPGIK